MPADSPDLAQRQHILLVTGLSGAGKTTALRVLEDLGWEAIDNFPIRLLVRLIGPPAADGPRAPLAIGFDTRTRGFDPVDVIERARASRRRLDALSTLAGRPSALRDRYLELRDVLGRSVPRRIRRGVRHCPRHHSHHVRRQLGPPAARRPGQ